jgi:hypothetical protein
VPQDIQSEISVMMNDNEKAQKQVRKYRASYWANNAVDEDFAKILGKGDNLNYPSYD